MNETVRKRVTQPLIALSVAASIALSGGVAFAAAQTRQSAQSAQSAQSSVANSLTYPRTITDEAGNKVTLRHAPVRIASVTEGTDEILTALVPLSHLVLVTTYGQNPQYSFVAAKIKKIPAITNATAEAILASHPDLVFLASYTQQGVVNQIRQAGVPVYELTDFNSIAQIEQNIVNVGTAVGAESTAQRIVANMKARLAAIHRAVMAAGTGQHRTVLNAYSDHYVPGRNTIVQDIITDAGATNAAYPVSGWRTVTDEQLVALNPNVLVLGQADAKFAESMLHNPKFTTISAIQKHDIHLIRDADLSTVSQYIVDAVADFAHVLYPHAKIPK